MVKSHEVAANVLVPDRLNGFPKALCIPELTSASCNFEDQAPYLVAGRVAAPHFAQLAVGWRLKGRKRLPKHGEATFCCMDIQCIASACGHVKTTAMQRRARTAL
ncbi:hypothetical protein C5615_30765 [Burkholderia cepacia]|uniref:Uncharacterized protein n=1 Tax=Burkholderia cepacia TaxID=292 RepID=A0A2S8IBQ6_BURCE|nr:hypothetical protein C5615_30765 [Burkholderia cepacia]